MRGHDPALQGRTIWVTRPPVQAGRLCALLESEGARAVRFPVIEIKPVSEVLETSAVLDVLQGIQLLVFVSVNAVEYAFDALPGFLYQLGDKQVLALGEATRDALQSRGVYQAQSAAGTGSEVLLESGPLNPVALKGKSVLIVRGVGGREAIFNHLQSNNIPVQCLEVYQRVCPVIDREHVEKLWREARPDALVVTSVEGLRNLIKMTAAVDSHELTQTPLAVMSERIGACASDMGFTSKYGVASEASDKGLIDAIKTIFGVHR